ncbi:uncharacterized protein LOC142235687 [Haematobia irritans]|uniref:uncharacterized protein LOC142235687 n=1 Tax=Haematobia irritans TaxID=7368 RepID=UPI003F5072DB
MRLQIARDIPTGYRSSGIFCVVVVATLCQCIGYQFIGALGFFEQFDKFMPVSVIAVCVLHSCQHYAAHLFYSHMLLSTIPLPITNTLVLLSVSPTAVQRQVLYTCNFSHIWFEYHVSGELADLVAILKAESRVVFIRVCPKLRVNFLPFYFISQVAAMSLDRFIRLADSLVEFEAALDGKELAVDKICLIETHRCEVQSIWEHLRQASDQCLAELANEEEPEGKGSKDDEDEEGQEASDTEKVKMKYKASYATYCRCVTKLTEYSQNLVPAAVTSVTHINSSYNLPPLELATFYSDYKSWPTFRDLFTALCIKNTKLSPIEKLVHLKQKTKGEAHEIVSKSPLTNDGFASAWRNLCERFENKRVLINEELKTLFNLQPIKSENADALKKLQRELNSCISNLKFYGTNIESWNAIFVFICSNCLPESTLTLWEQTLSDKTTVPPWSELNVFLTNRYRTLESVLEVRRCESPKQVLSKQRTLSNSKSSSEKVRAFQTNVDKTQCKLCPTEFHPIRKCPRFMAMNQTQRLTEIKSKNLCLNCFSAAHGVRNCKSKHSCFKCKKRHNTLLHKEANPQVVATHTLPSTSSGPRIDVAPQTSQVQIQSTIPTSNVVQTCFASNSRGVLLGTAIVNLLHYGVVYQARALIDSGSEGTFISDRLFNMLKLPFRKTAARISGLNNSISADVQKECDFRLRSNKDLNFEIGVTALVVPHLSNNLPASTIDSLAISDFPDIELADPGLFESSRIDILLGADVLPSIMLQGCRLGVCGSLMAQQTVFGWIITGPVHNETPYSQTTCVSYFCEISLDKEISRFWEVENIPQKRFMSQSDKFCDELYKSTTKRNDEGRYIVSLPFKEEYPQDINLGHSRASAMAKYFRNESRLLKIPQFKNEYDSTLEEYLTLKHMVPVSAPNPLHDSSYYYLPHHAVIKPESTTTKVRVVFNASAASSNGSSLNDLLHIGPSVQNDLTLLILKWRFYRYVFNGDIQKMYRQILVNKDHTPFQRILYRKCPKGPIQDYELQTVTFGVNSAPYLAIRTMIQLADDVKYTYPLASNVLKSSMYVDDALVGAHTISTAIQTRDEVIAALRSAGFSMRKWTSNSKRILEGLPTEDLLYSDFLDFDDHSSAKTLGIRWNARSDHFYFSTVAFPQNCLNTKREVLSQISRLFDPAGWLAPIVITAKIIMQKIWMDRTEWDAVITPETLALWKSFKDNCQHIDNIQIPRWIKFVPDCDVQIHGFCDASQKAYAAAIYIRIVFQDSIHVNLISSKTKVAPLKTISIPRLELCGATLLAEIIDALIPNFEIPNYSIYCWCDSTIVLAWLAKPPCYWNTFVANRVSKIIEVVNASRWFHIDTEHNPADIASRGLPPLELLENELWWKGPYWLSKPMATWPESKSHNAEDICLEKRLIKVHFSYFSNYQDALERFSSYSRALRVISYIYRFFYRTHPKFRDNFCKASIALTSAEIIFARKQLIIVCQKAFYPNEYSCLNSKKSISKSSPLLNLNPFVDNEGFMRVCGRLESSPNLTYSERHPIILPYGCQYSRLLIKFIHDITLHGGNQLLLRLVRTQYWIPKVQNLIKTTIHNCKICVLYKRRCQQQLMAALPPERCEFSRPFTHTGLDFAGPFDVKSYSGRFCRISKGYVVVFVCFSTKAIHLEGTSDLSTPAFLGAFSRFVSRRGCPLHLHSDNGTTFMGASRVLAKEFIQTSHLAITANYSHQNLTWHFIPPGAPHMGGLWEAGVKSFKLHFKKIAGGMKYTFEELQTLLTKIEACLNSRPLSPSSENPYPEYRETPLSIQNRWQRLKAVHQHFCTRWKNEYLKELQKRNKWKWPEANLTVDTFVVVRDENLPPNCWRLGRITKVYQGSDNRVRVADILTQRGTITRPITKLVVLFNENN